MVEHIEKKFPISDHSPSGILLDGFGHAFRTANSAGDAHSALALLRCLDTAGIDITPETHKAKEND